MDETTEALVLDPVAPMDIALEPIRLPLVRHAEDRELEYLVFGYHYSLTSCSVKCS